MCVLCFYGNQLRCQDFMVDVLRENNGSVNDVTFVNDSAQSGVLRERLVAYGQVLLIKLILTYHKYGFVCFFIKLEHVQFYKEINNLDNYDLDDTDVFTSFISDVAISI